VVFNNFIVAQKQVQRSVKVTRVEFSFDWLKLVLGTIGEEPSALLYYSSPKPRLAVAYSKYISLLYPQWTSTNTQ
jgi:hypothetical protein